MSKIKESLLLFAVLCISLLTWQYSQMKTVSLRFLDQEGAQHILSLPARDKERLFCFVKILFAEDNFAYTLLGSKPLSWASYQKPWPFVDWDLFRNSLKRYSSTLRVGWKTWAKYRHLFPNAPLWEEPSDNLGWRHILIINQESFNRVVKQNRQDFETILHRDVVDGLQLLKEAKNRSLMSDLLQGHQALLGIVLGYGRQNAWDFLKGAEKREPLRWVWDEEFKETPGEIVFRTGPTDIQGCLEMLSCPSFAGHPLSEESMALKKEYLLTKQKVLSYYKDKDFLEATLSLLAGFRPQD